MNKKNYSGLMAQFYDELYKEKPYKAEATFIHNQIQKHLGAGKWSILELACGTGTHSLILSEYGYDILATDRSEDSLNIARKKNSSEKLRFQNLDMLTPSDLGKFDVVICLFDSIGYLIDNENISRLFKYVQSSLKPNGLFLFEYWHASAFLKNYEPSRYRFLENINLHRISNTQINYEQQYASVNYRFFLNDLYYEETHNNRFFLPQEMNLFIQHHGFELCDRFAGYSENRKIDENTWHILDIIKIK